MDADMYQQTLVLVAAFLAAGSIDSEGTNAEFAVERYAEVMDELRKRPSLLDPRAKP
jgi:hypothetical protein